METGEKIGFFERLKISIFKFEDYARLAAQKISKAVIYMLILMLVFALCVSAATTYKFSQSLNDLANYISNEIENTIDGYVAEEIGLQPGDKIVEIEGKEVKSKYDLDDVTKNITENREISLKIDRNGEIIEYKTKLTEVASKVTGLYLDEKGKVITVEKGSVAEKQGIQANDKIIKINNENVNEDITKIVEQIQQKGVGTVLLTIERGDETLNIELTPDHEYSYYLGVNLKIAENTIINHIIYGAVETKEFSLSIIDNLKQLFTGKVGIDQMMGPVGISEAVAKTTGIEDFVYMLALISLLLGVTNLLPIPALDGGKILILLIEAIRRKPLKQETELNIQLLGFSFLIVLSLYVAYNDILRIF